MTIREGNRLFWNGGSLWCHALTCATTMRLFINEIIHCSVTAVASIVNATPELPCLIGSKSEKTSKSLNCCFEKMQFCEFWNPTPCPLRQSPGKWNEKLQEFFSHRISEQWQMFIKILKFIILVSFIKVLFYNEKIIPFFC